MNQCWKAITHPKLIWRCWDNEYVVYNDTTGHTHRLDTVPAKALKSLENSPATERELSVRIAAILDSDADNKVAIIVRDMINDFRRCSLIEPVEP